MGVIKANVVVGAALVLAAVALLLLLDCTQHRDPDPVPSLAASQSAVRGSSHDVAVVVEEDMARRDLAFRTAHQDLPNYKKLPDMINLWAPTASCPDAEWVGFGGDGSKWACGVRRLTEPCVVYSFGSGGQVQFESEMLRLTPCVVHVFDPTVHPTIKAKVRQKLGPRVVWHDIGVGVANGTMRAVGPVASVTEHMTVNGHSRIDLLKMDVEGAEVDVILGRTTDGSIGSQPSTPNNQWLKHVDQLLLEVHFRSHNLAQMPLLFAALSKAGLAMFSRELNVLCHTCAEYSFVRRS